MNHPNNRLLLASTLSLLLATGNLAGAAADSQPVDGTENSAIKASSRLNGKKLNLMSENAIIVTDQGQVLYAKNATEQKPIASITKLMSTMVLLDSGVPLDEPIDIVKEDRDRIRLTGSRLRYKDKARLSRRDLVLLMLMSSENRAAAAIGRTTLPGGTAAFVRAMNRKAASLGMSNTHFADPAGLDAANLSSAADLALLLRAAYQYPEIRDASTKLGATVHPYEKLGALAYHNTNRLLRNERWQIGLSKTGYINESGRCLVMQAHLAGRQAYIVLLDSYGKLTPFADANRIRDWFEQELTMAKG